MFSVSPAEIVTITVIALLVFGPQRLPEITRRIGKLGRELSRAAQDLKQGIEREIDDASAPLDEVRRSLGTTISESTERPATVPDPDDAEEGVSEPDDDQGESDG